MSCQECEEVVREKKENEIQELESHQLSFSISLLGKRQVPAFRATQMLYSMRFLETIHPHEALLNGCSDLIDRCFEDAGPKDKVCLTITHPDIRNPIGIPCSTREKLTAKRVLSIIENNIQRSETVRYEAEWEVEAIRFAYPENWP